MSTKKSKKKGVWKKASSKKVSYLDKRDLVSALRRSGKKAMQNAKDNGLSVMILKDGYLVSRHPDGTETKVKKSLAKRVKVAKRVYALA